MRRFYSNGKGAAFTADGTTAGVITVASTTGLFAGATAWVSDNSGTNNLLVLISEITDSTHLKVRRTYAGGFGNAGADSGPIGKGAGDRRVADMSGFLATNSARIDMEPQLVEDPSQSA